MNQQDKKQAVKLVLGMKKEQNIPDKFGIMPDLTGKTLVEAIKIAKALKLKLQVKGKGIIKKQNPLPGKKVKIGEICKVIAN